jgi:replicative DNA helicase
MYIVVFIILGNGEERGLIMSTLIDRSGSKLKGSKKVSEIADNIINMLNTRGSIADSRLNLNTGISLLDECLPGFQPSEVTIISGRPAMGKTSLALQILSAAARQQPAPLVYFTCSDAAEKIFTRLISLELKQESSATTESNLSADQMNEIVMALNEVSEKNIIIDDTPFPTEEYVSAQLRAIHDHVGKPALAIIDNIEHVQSADVSLNPDMNKRLRNSMQAFKQIALDHECHVIALSRINRRIEYRENKRPMISDLYGSGAIEQIADAIWILYRDEVYSDYSKDKGVIEIFVSNPYQILFRLKWDPIKGNFSSL